MEQGERVGYIEQMACKDMVLAAGAAMHGELGLAAEHRGGALVLRAPGIPHPLHNRVVGLCARDEEEAAERIEWALSSFEAWGIQRYLIQVPQAAAEDGLRRCLLARGLTRFHRNWVALTRGRGPVPAWPSTARVEAVGPERAEALGRILVRGFDLPEAATPLYAGVVGRPGWFAYLAWLGDEVAGAGLLFVEGGTAYLAGGATRPELRGRGVQGALMRARVERALALGCDLLVSNTGEAVTGEPNSSYNNMLRCRFSPVSVTENWARPGLGRFSSGRAKS